MKPSDELRLNVTGLEMTTDAQQPGCLRFHIYGGVVWLERKEVQQLRDHLSQWLASDASQGGPYCYHDWDTCDDLLTRCRHCNRVLEEAG